MNKTIDCVILNYNDYDTTESLINHIKNYDIINKIVIVDNNSSDNSYLRLKRFANIKIDVIKSSDNRGYGSGNNIGINYLMKKYNSKYILISNPDVIFEEGLLNKLLIYIKTESAAVASARQKDINDNFFLINGWDVPSSIRYTLSSFLIFRKLQNKTFSKYNYFDEYVLYPDCVPGALLLIDSEIFMKVGGYDENIFLYGEETLVGFKLKTAGYKTILLDEFYYHHHSTTISKFLNKRKQLNQIIKSRRYIVKNYLNNNKYTNWFYEFIFLLATIENYIILMVKMIFRKER